MPPLMPRDTCNALGDDLKNCNSRALLLDRFCDPSAKEDARKAVFRRAFRRGADTLKITAWARWLDSLAKAEPGTNILYAQLQSRLMVNMAGGVMENAGLCLDRFGLPYIPGSAVKGCARRAALAALREWSEAGGKPELKPAADDNPLTAACKPFATPAEMRAAIARVFGQCTQDLSDQSDQSISAGSIAFLPAYPADLGRTGNVTDLPLPVPELGKLELDVVTCHHRDYYAGTLDTATDTEEPNPVVFPAVAPGHVFTFALTTLRNCPDTSLQYALTWLATGLQTFGLGAKTNAGYGWFDCSQTTHTAVANLQVQKAERERMAAKEKAEREKAKAEAEAKAAEKAKREAALAGLSPEERADKEIEFLNDQQFDTKVRAFCKEPKKGGPTEDLKKAIVRALRGPRRHYWQEFKTKAVKGDLANVANAIRRLSKDMFGEKEGKMP